LYHLAAPARGAIFDFHAVLLGSSELPANASSATGTADVVLNDGTGILSITETFTGLSAPATGAHIHCCTPASVSAPVALPFGSFPTTTSGTSSQTFDLATPLLLVNVTEAQFIAGLEAGLGYVNIHDANFPAGEIRGQLIPTVPEPATWAMLLIGFAGIGFAAKWRRGRKTSASGDDQSHGIVTDAEQATLPACLSSAALDECRLA
jgi:hypothetical protein